MYPQVHPNAPKNDDVSSSTKNISHLLLYIPSIIILPFIVLVGICFAVLRQIVNIILKIRHKNDYAGLLCSADTVWAVEDASRSIIHGTFLVNYNQEGDFNEKMREIVTEKFGKLPKLSYIRKQFMGYYYFLKNQVDVKDFLKQIDDSVCTEEDLKDFLSSICNQPLPKDGTTMWDCHIGTKGIKWSNNTNLLYPITFRFHHTGGDGWAVLNILQTEIFGVPTITKWPQNSSAPTNTEEDRFKFDFNRFVHGFVKMISSLVRIVQMILEAPIRVVYWTYVKENDRNALHGKPLSGEKLTVWATEGAVDLVPVCKDIRKQLNVRFTDVVNSAVGASLNNYFKRNKLDIPDYVTAVIPVLMLPKNLEDKVILSNNISFVFLDVPVSVTPFSMLGLLKEASIKSQKMKKLPDAQVNYWLLNCFSGIVPLPLLRIILNNSKMSIAISNLPGGENLTALGSCTVEDFALFPPHRGNTGVTFAISTYDNKFQLMLLVDKALLSSKKEAQIIIDDVFKNLRLLNEERKHISVETKKEL